MKLLTVATAQYSLADIQSDEAFWFRIGTGKKHHNQKVVVLLFHYGA